MEKKSDSSGSYVFVIFILLFLIELVRRIAEYFQDPGNIAHFIDALVSLGYALASLGICLGMVILGPLLLNLYSLIFPPRYESTLQLLSKEYPVRCIPLEIDGESDAQVLQVAFQELVGELAYLLFSRTSYGIGLRPISTQYTWDRIPEDNESRYRALSNDLPGRIILPHGFTSLYYRWADELNAESYPGTGDGYSGPLPGDPGNRNIEIVIVYRAILEEENLHQILNLERVLKLKMIVLDQDGRDDMVATRELYKLVYEFMNPPDTSYDDYEYFRSRPIWY